MMAKMVKALAANVAVTVLAVATLATAEAEAQSRRTEETRSHVKVCGTYNRGCTSAPVRRGRNGAEIRLPGGSWIPCRANCQDTLREETVDFWETQRENQPF
jgi:hypothetical protein